MISVTSVEHPSEYRLRIAFSDGTSGDADLTALLDEDAFTSLRGDVFALAFLDHDAGTVAWPSGLDVAPDTLYALAHGFRRPESFEDAQANERAVRLRKE